MKRRVAIWSGVGYLVAWCWILWTFIATPQSLNAALRLPAVETLLFTTCPIVSIVWHTPFHYWWIPPVNAATYGVCALLLEMLRRRSNWPVRKITY